MNLKESATRVAVLRVLRDTVDAAYEAERRTVLDGLRAARAEFALKSIRVTLPDQTPVATITLIDPQPAVVVADEDAFTAWVAANHPREVETLVRVRPGEKVPVDGVIRGMGNTFGAKYWSWVVILGALWLAWWGLIRRRASRVAEGTILVAEREPLLRRRGGPSAPGGAAKAEEIGRLYRTYHFD